MRDEVPAESSPIDSRAMRWTQRLCVAAAALAAAAFARGGYIVAKAELGQWLLQSAWQRTQATGVAAKPWPWADMHPVARLLAPAQNIDVIVLSGATGRTLAWGPGHLDGSARAGDAGNAVFTAHRDTHFAFLEHAKVGERIIVERIDGTRVQFRITGVAIVAAKALKLRAGTDIATLTLVTCYPFDALAPNTPWRYVVNAKISGIDFTWTHGRGDVAAILGNRAHSNIDHEVSGRVACAAACPAMPPPPPIAPPQ